MTTNASTNPAPLTPPADDGEGNDGSEVVAIGFRLLEDAYLAWTAAEGECERALQAWLEPGSGRHELAYPVYRAALDREEAAARDLQRLIEITAPCIHLRV